jgi:arsenite methyltransferase
MKDYLKHSFSIDDFDLVSVIDELPLWSAPFGLDLLNAVTLRPKIVALDIGCGLGFPLIELALRLGNSGKVFGLDPWARAIERIHLKVKVLNIKNVEVIQGVAEKMPFEDGYFDLLVSNNGINNVEDMKRSLSECSRVSKSGAQFVITFNLENTMREFYEVFEETLKENNRLDEINKMKAQIYSKRKPLDEVESLLKEAGFRIGNIEQKSFKWDFLDGATMFNHYLIKYWFLDGWKNILKDDDRERIFDPVEKKINGIAEQKGCFSLTIPYVTMVCYKLGSFNSCLGHS